METALRIITDVLGHALPFEWASPEFMRRALVAVLLVCPACATMGVLVINRRMVFFSEAISHSAFTGIAIGLLLGLKQPFPVMVGFCLLVGLGIAMIGDRSLLAADTVIGVFFATTISLGLVIIGALQGLARQLPAFLFGDILAVSAGELACMFALAALVLVYMWFSFNTLTLSAVSPEMASARGFSIKFLEYGFAALLALLVAVSIRVTGMLLITAMLVVPAAAARNASSTAKTFFWLSGVIALVSGIAGLAGSYYLNTATGASIILVASVFFFATLIFRRFWGRR